MKKLGFLLTVISFVVLVASCITGKEQEHTVDRSEFDWQLVWSDEFEGDVIDSSKWNYINGAGGYGNNELQFYSDREENVRVEKGNLILEAHEEEYKGSPYTSAKITTQDKGDWTYGRYEIRAKLPIGQGIWPAFWMMPTDYDVYGAWPACGEIDIMELLGHQPSITHGTLHYGNPYKYSGTSTTLDKGTFNDAYHIFAIEWLPGEIRWYLDGELFQVQDEWHSNAGGIGEDLTFPAPFDRDFYMQFNLAVGGNWPGSPDDSTVFPQQVVVDWIRVYESASGYPNITPKKAKSDVAAAPGRDPLEDGNYVYNNTFDENFDSWSFENHEGGSGQAVVEESELHVAIKSAGGQTWANQLYQTEMNVKQGGTYNVSFKARSAEPREFMLKIGGLADRGWAAYSGEIIVELDTQMKEYSYEFTMKEKTDTKARYELNMGLSDVDIWLDDVKLMLVGGENKSNVKAVIPSRKPLPNGNLIYNGTFDKGAGRLAYWKTELDSGSDAMISVMPELYQREGKVAILDASDSDNAVVIYQDNIDLIADETYRFSLDASSRKDKNIKVVIQDNKGNNITTPVTLSIGTEMGRSFVDLPITEDYSKIRVAILCAIDGNSSSFVMDNVSFIKLKKPSKVLGLTRIEAEDFFSKTDTPQTQGCDEGGLNVGWMTEGDWLKYLLDVDTAGTYTISYRVASERSDLPLKAESELGSDTNTFDGTGAWQSWTTVTGEIDLPQGESFLTLSAVDVNINWIELELK